MRLAELQRVFQDYLLGRSDAMTQAVNTNARIGAADLLLVYRRGYTQRLVEALGNDFPGLKGLLGEEDFERMAIGYVATHPSQHPSLRWLGRGFPAYLAHPGRTRHPLAASMARFDWAVALAFDAPDGPVAGLSALLALPPAAWESFRLVFVAGVSDFVADAATGNLRRALLHDEADLPSAAGYESHWLTWRQGEEVQYRSLGNDEAAALDLMQGGGDFAAMCRLLAEEFGRVDAAQRSAEILKDWLERGLVAAIDHDAAISL